MKRIVTIVAALLMAALTLTAQEAPKKYGIKSGTAKAMMSMLGQRVETTMYFDDYGALEATVTTTAGVEVLSISRDGKTYIVNPGSRQVQETPTPESVNYMDLNDEVMAKYKIKEIGKETVAGKECTQYEVEVTQAGQTVKTSVSVWEGFPMKTVANVMGMSLSMAVSEFVEGPVDASHFEIPKFE